MGNRGRKPAISESALIDAVDALTRPEQPVADTGEVFDQLDQDVSERTVRDTLRKFDEDEDSPISGRTPGEQNGWHWWLTPDDTSHEAEK